MYVSAVQTRGAGAAAGRSSTACMPARLRDAGPFAGAIRAGGRPHAAGGTGRAQACSRGWHICMRPGGAKAENTSESGRMRVTWLRLVAGADCISGRRGRKLT